MATSTAPVHPLVRRFEVLAGRSLAACVHPVAAWRMRARVRVAIIAGYVAAGFTGGLAVLTLLG
jgi:hypothetical protein